MIQKITSKKVIQKKVSDASIQVFEELNGSKASDKIKKALSKRSKKTGTSIHSILKKANKEKLKAAKKEKKASVKQSKKATVKKS